MKNSIDTAQQRTGATQWIVLAAGLVLLPIGCGQSRTEDLPPSMQGKAEGVAVSELDLLQMKISKHPAGGPCSRCHVGAGRKRKTNKPIPQLCYDCHEDYSEQATHVHGPVAVGDCMFCHEPHSSIYVHLQKLSQPRLCTRCHEMEDYAASDTHPNASGRLCTECHEPHVASNQMFLKRRFR